MKTAVIGSRSFANANLLEKTLDTYTITELISGGAKGADKLAEAYAKTRQIPSLIFLPDYQKYGGKSAPLKRNEQIIEAAEQVLAFWDQTSKGTLHAINYAKRLGKRVFIIPFAEPQQTGKNPSPGQFEMSF